MRRCLPWCVICAPGLRLSAATSLHTPWLSGTSRNGLPGYPAFQENQGPVTMTILSLSPVLQLTRCFQALTHPNELLWLWLFLWLSMMIVSRVLFATHRYM